MTYTYIGSSNSKYGIIIHVYLTKFKNYSCDNGEIIIYHQTINIICPYYIRIVIISFQLIMLKIKYDYTKSLDEISESCED